MLVVICYNSSWKRITAMQKQDLQVTREKEKLEESIAKAKILRWQPVAGVEEQIGM